MRKKKRPNHLDSETSDKESEPEIDTSTRKRTKIAKKSLDNCNIFKKTYNKFETKMKSPPPVPLVLPERFTLSPDRITRHISQPSKQPTFSLSDSKGSGRLQKISLQKENEEKKILTIKKLKLHKQNLKMKKHNKENIWKSPTSTETIKENVQEELSNLNTSNIFMAKRHIQVVSLSISDQISLNSSSCISSLIAHDNLRSNQEYGESSQVPMNITDNQCTLIQDESGNKEEEYLPVTDFSSLIDIISDLSNMRKEISSLSSKMDICLMNQEKINRFLLPGEKVVKRPPNFPSLPVNTEVQLSDVEHFLTDDNNLSAASMYFAKYVDPGSLDNSVRKMLSKIITNTLAQNFSFQGHGNKYKFEALKTWDLIQGALLLHFEADSLAAVEKVAGSWLANAKWRQQSDGTSLRQSSTSKD